MKGISGFIICICGRNSVHILPTSDIHVVSHSYPRQLAVKLFHKSASSPIWLFAVFSAERASWLIGEKIIRWMIGLTSCAGSFSQYIQGDAGMCRQCCFGYWLFSDISNSLRRITKKKRKKSFEGIFLVHHTTKWHFVAKWEFEHCTAIHSIVLIFECALTIKLSCTPGSDLGGSLYTGHTC